jgi:hypothetical protein
MKHKRPICILVAVLAGVSGRASVCAAEETVQGMLAAQIRMQGYTCEKAVGATRDAKRSRPDHDVWILKCSNASYRVSRAPDMAAKIEPIR